MDKLEIKQGSFIQQTQYFIPVEIYLSVVPAHLGIWFFHLSRQTTVIQDLLVRRQFSLVPDNRTNVNVEACGRDLMVVGLTTTYAICAYHHWCCEFESRSGRGVQHYVIKFVVYLWQVGGFLGVLRFPPPIKLTATI
jgi:hypothetical protein